MVAHDTAIDASVAVWCNRLDPGPDELIASVVAVHDLPLALGR